MPPHAPEIRPPLPQRVLASLAHWCDCPPSGHGFCGRRFREGGRIVVHVERCDWLERRQITPQFRADAFDFGPRAHWDEARQLSQALLGAHFDRFEPTRDWRGRIVPTRHIERILRDEFARQIVRRLPDKWHLDDAALGAWVWHFRARKFYYLGGQVRGFPS